jgi:hypothetical protein
MLSAQANGAGRLWQLNAGQIMVEHRYDSTKHGF